ADGSTVRREVDLRPTLGNAGHVDAVDFLLDGTLIQHVTAPPWAFSWDASIVDAGPHELVVQAQAGDRKAEQRLGIVVAPAVTVEIQQPGAPAIDGTVTLTANIDAVTSVQ